MAVHLHFHHFRHLSLVHSFILNWRLGSLANPFHHSPFPCLPDWFYGLSAHLTFFISAQRLDFLVQCVRLNRLSVGFRTHLKSFQFHFIHFISSWLTTGEVCDDYDDIVLNDTDHGDRCFVCSSIATATERIRWSRQLYSMLSDIVYFLAQLAELMGQKLSLSPFLSLPLSHTLCVCVLTRVAQIITATRRDLCNPALGSGHAPRTTPHRKNPQAISPWKVPSWASLSTDGLFN